MIGTEEAIEILEHAAGETIVNIQLLPAGYVRGCLLNHVDIRRTYRVIVDPQEGIYEGLDDLDCRNPEQGGGLSGSTREVQLVFGMKITQI